ncbi:hypothetical protein QFZ77_007471 [Paenibacillus sp. V4I3]|uniref:hypothetical protein n=1 Tax=Paenibacillus sp. V4I3 TaxID=3042305 RepID=UPI00278A29B1|nr:hypothetical protein [Paenibacillus sp. V4I3]MDQ0878812.1 hypothetical protein [Paenibacillus sp. V4I3]
MDSEEKDKYDLVRAFPRDLNKDVRQVLDIIPQESHLTFSYFEELRLSEEALYIPSRIYYDEPPQSQISSLTVDQQTILYTLYTRHHNGYVREKNVKNAIAKAAECSWITAYLMLIIGEYVEEILQVIHQNRSLLNADFIKIFVDENPKLYRTIQSRVVSYWNCYYRWKYPKPEQYVGFQVLAHLKRLLN